MGATTRQRLVESGNKKRLAEYDSKHKPKTDVVTTSPKPPVTHTPSH